MAFCLPLCQMCGKDSLLQIRSQINMGCHLYQNYATIINIKKWIIYVCFPWFMHA